MKELLRLVIAFGIGLFVFAWLNEKLSYSVEGVSMAMLGGIGAFVLIIFPVLNFEGKEEK